MNTPTTISPLEAFQKAFLGIAWTIDDYHLLYPINDRACAERAEARARQLIFMRGLALMAAVEEYPWRGEMKIALVIRPVPEEYTFEDEVQDTEDYQEERAEWVAE